MDIWTTTDFFDEIIYAGRHYTEDEIDAIMAYCASLGSTCHEWVLDTIWTLYDEDPPQGYDLLATACDAAHRHGMRFEVVYKPFEGALPHPLMILPETIPEFDPQTRLLREPQGLAHAVRPFVAAHPELRMARRPSDRDPGGRIHELRLIRKGDDPAGLTLDDLTLWISNRNGGFERYTGPIEWRDWTEWRTGHPHSDRACRIVALSGLELPMDVQALRLTCEPCGAGFANEVEKLVELVNDRGELIPSMPACRRVDAEKLLERARRYARLGLTELTRAPAVREYLLESDQLLSDAADSFIFTIGWEQLALDEIGEFVVLRGKPEHAPGLLHPIYPQVRQHWLDDLRTCLDRGVDGVNIRTGNHTRPYEPWTYGFNKPVLQQMSDPDRVAEARRRNGEAYTRFLSEAADLLHGAGKRLGVHANAQMLHHDDRSANNQPLPPNIDFQWEHWVADLVDYVELRGLNTLREENIHDVVDRIGLVARDAGKPFILQSLRSAAVFRPEGDLPAMQHQLDWARRHPYISACNLYETADYMDIGPDNRPRGSDTLRQLVNDAT